MEHLSLKGSTYEVELTRSNATYLAEVDGETGKVLSLFQTKEKIWKKRRLHQLGRMGPSEEKVVDKSVEETESHSDIAAYNRVQRQNLK